MKVEDDIEFLHGEASYELHVKFISNSFGNLSLAKSRRTLHHQHLGVVDKSLGGSIEQGVQILDSEEDEASRFPEVLLFM